MRRSVLIGLCLAACSGLVGWLHAASAVQQGQVQNDIWSEAASLSVDASALKAKVASVKATELLKLSRKAEEKLAEANGEGSEAADNNRPKFPLMAAASQRNGKSYVNVIFPDGSIGEIQAGDTLSSGWVIKSVDLRQVIAVFEGEEERFIIRPYLETAFDKPQETAEPQEAGEN